MGLLDDKETDLEPAAENERVDFGTHEVFVKTDINFSDSGLIVAPSQRDETTYKSKTVKPTTEQTKQKQQKQQQQVRRKPKSQKKRKKTMKNPHFIKKTKHKNIS